MTPLEWYRTRRVGRAIELAPRLADNPPSLPERREWAPLVEAWGWRLWRQPSSRAYLRESFYRVRGFRMNRCWKDVSVFGSATTTMRLATSHSSIAASRFSISAFVIAPRSAARLSLACASTYMVAHCPETARRGIARVYPGWTEAGAGQCCYRDHLISRGVVSGPEGYGYPRVEAGRGGGGAIESPPRGGAAAAGLLKWPHQGLRCPPRRNVAAAFSRCCCGVVRDCRRRDANAMHATATQTRTKAMKPAVIRPVSPGARFPNLKSLELVIEGAWFPGGSGTGIRAWRPSRRRRCHKEVPAP